ncbi:fatty acid-binding protein, epidermal [Reticulomyxa filosa]|uniref:Fatty acid-binding protein, epidermal n=1 Tax=Reticulomyxa filosa TaxID=46433 RepID=X6MA47_RETFI|nr:fatty acid-binding protein, epidermal [Reticulomyxa filosa]|eukprot:ETO10352.1 fatty acid-binding protein, epidermal [Reticulomyxa filosa]
MTQEVVTLKMMDFEGSWQLVKNENVEEYMKSVNVGWLLRKIANKLHMKIVTTKKNEFTLAMSITVSGGISKTQQICVIADSVTEQEEENPIGDKIKFVTKILEDGSLESQFNNITQGIKGTLKRYIDKNGAMVMEVKNDKNIVMKRFFEKQ